MVSKQPNLVRGNKIRCINFQMCPLCYGCRSYDSRDPECVICKTEDAKMNVCNTNLHEAWKIDRMITKDIVKINDEIIFKNGGK
jgi:hypothetical protein